MINFIEWLTIAFFMFSLAAENFIQFLLLLSMSIITGTIGHYLGIRSLEIGDSND